MMNKQEFENYIKEKNKKYIIFDFDETLCTLLINWDPWCEELDNLFLSYDMVSKDDSDLSYAEMINLCIDKYGEEARDKILEINYRNEKDCSSGYELSPTAIPLLELSKEYAELYLWTSNDRRTIMPILKELDMEKFFKKIVTRNDVKYVKPKADGFSLIYDKNNSKSDYLFIGDSAADSGAAQNSGIDFLNIVEIKFN